MKTRYFLITGLNEGKPITPYIEETNGMLPDIILNPPYGDCARYYEEITEGEAKKKNIIKNKKMEKMIGRSMILVHSPVLSLNHVVGQTFKVLEVNTYLDRYEIEIENQRWSLPYEYLKEVE